MIAKLRAKKEYHRRYLILSCLQFHGPTKPGIPNKADLFDNDPIGIAFLETMIIPHMALAVFKDPRPAILCENTVAAVDQFQSQVAPFTIDLVEKDYAGLHPGTWRFEIYGDKVAGIQDYTFVWQ